MKEARNDKMHVKSDSALLSSSFCVDVTEANQTNQVIPYHVYVSAVYPIPLRWRFLIPTKHYPCRTRAVKLKSHRTGLCFLALVFLSEKYIITLNISQRKVHRIAVVWLLFVLPFQSFTNTKKLEFLISVENILKRIRNCRTCSSVLCMSKTLCLQTSAFGRLGYSLYVCILQNVGWSGNQNL